VKLDFYEADVLVWFLREQKSQFIKCADEFGYEQDEAADMHDTICRKALDELFVAITHSRKRRLTTPIKSQDAQQSGGLHRLQHAGR
jgi:hypothetical protein